ncbi:MAG: transposase, partial [Delftia sp.]|nr:transposase [Delftia sp.]
RSSSLPEIANKVPDGTKETSREQKYRRWVANDAIEADVYFLPYAQALLLSLGLPEIVLAIDVSAVGRGCAVLMVSVIYKKRVLPLVWVVARGNKGHFSEENHVKLIREVQDIIPESGKKVVVPGDGEFDGTHFQKAVADRGWFYVCRTAGNIKIFLDGEEYAVSDISFLILPGFHTHVEDVLFTNKKYGPVTVIMWWDEGYKDPIYLVTNIKSSEDAIYYYSKRFRTETFFSDQKSRGFNIDKSHLSDPDRLSRFLIATCLAYIWIVFLGTLAVRQGWDKIIHRTDRCDLSLFQMGLKLLEHFLNEDIPIPVAFQIFNPTD